MSGVASTVLRNSLAGLGAQAIIKVLSFGFSVLVVRHLGAEQYGQYAAVIAFGAMFVFLADLGLGVYLVREVSRLRFATDGLAQIGRLFANGLALRFLLACGAAILLIASAIFTERPTPMVIAIAMGTLGLLAYSVQGACESVLAGFERLDITALARVAHQVVFIVVGTAVLIAGVGYHGLVVATILSATLMAVVCWRGVRRLGVSLGVASPAIWPGLLRASAPFAIIAGTLGLSYKFDSVILNVVRGDAETGFYSAAYSLVFAAAFLSNALNTALYPSLTRQATENPAALPTFYEHAIRTLMLLSLPITFGGWAVADQLTIMLFGQSYGPAGPVLGLLIWAVPLMFASEFLGYVVIVRGEERRVARSVMVSTSINITGNLLAIPWLGFTGAAIMTVVTEAVLVVQYGWYLRSAFAGVQWTKVFWYPLLAAATMAGLALAVPTLPLPLVVATSAAVYTGLLMALRVVGRDDLRVVRRALRHEPPPPVSPSADRQSVVASPAI